MTPEWKLVINLCPKSAFHPRFTCRGQIWQKSVVAKLPIEKSSRIAYKKHDVRDTSELSISPPLNLSRPKFREPCPLLSCARVGLTNQGRIHGGGRWGRSPPQRSEKITSSTIVVNFCADFVGVPVISALFCNQAPSTILIV